MGNLQIAGQKLAKDIAFIPIAGFMDTQVLPEVEATLEKFYKQGVVKFVIDLSELDHMTSSGIELVIRFLEKVRMENGNIVLLRPNAEVQESLNIFGLTDILKKAKDLPEATRLLG